MEYYLCILDFEATCWSSMNNSNTYQMEIIEFPSILYKINEQDKIYTYVSEFSKYVRPIMNPTLSEFCTELTGITQETVDVADTFDIVYIQHQEWLHQHVPDGKELIIVTCGDWDLGTQLPRELKNKKLKLHPYYNKYMNIKNPYKSLYKVNPKGMMGMLDYLKIQHEGRHHSGIDDTRNIAKIMLRILSDGYTYDKFYIKKSIEL